MSNNLKTVDGVDIVPWMPVYTEEGARYTVLGQVNKENTDSVSLGQLNQDYQVDNVHVIDTTVIGGGPLALYTLLISKMFSTLKAAIRHKAEDLRKQADKLEAESQ